MIQLFQGNCLDLLPKLPAQSVQTCVTSPPYLWQRDYNAKQQIGQEKTLADYIETMVRVFREVRRVLRDDGSVWINLGDTYRNKNLLGVPWRVALALQDDGWNLRNEVIWHHSNKLPENVKDRLTRGHETIFFLTKSRTYHFDQMAIAVPVQPSTVARRKRRDSRDAGMSEKYTSGHKADRHCAGARMVSGRCLTPELANRRTIWTVAHAGTKENHHAAYSEKLIEPCILASCPPGEVVLDPFAGTGTTLAAAKRLGRQGVGIELNREYAEIMRQRFGLPPA